MGQARWKMYLHHTISAILPSTYQNLLKFMEIWRSSDRIKNAQFFWNTVYPLSINSWQGLQRQYSVYTTQHVL